MPGHHHRSGPLKQTNKRNKRSTSSKRSISKLAGGKVEGRRPGFKQQIIAHTKADRRHIQQQRREAKRTELLRRKRGLDGGPAPPRVVGIISLGENEGTEEKLRELIAGQADRVVRTQHASSNVTMSARYEVHKKDGNLTLLTNSTSFKCQYVNEDPINAAVMGALDLCRVCDIILFVVDGDADRPEENVLGMSIGGDEPSVMTSKTNSTSQDWDHLISERGDRILAAVKGQGIPRVATILARTEADVEAEDDHTRMTTQSAKSVRRATFKKKTDLKKYASRFATTEFGVDNDKVIEVSLKELDTDEGMEETDKMDPQEHAKQILAAALVRNLCTMSAAPSKWVSQVPRAFLVSDKQKYDSTTKELHLTGFVRGAVPFDVNALVHVPNLGTFACKSIREASHPMSRSKNDVDTNTDVLESDPMKRESLNRFATPDALDGEQNLIGFDEADEEFDENNEKDEEKDTEFARPAGWSDYQAAWLDAVEDDGTQSDFDNGELSRQLNQKSSATVATEANMDLEDANMISEEERKLLVEQRRKEQKEHLEFPDEVQVNEDEKARERFARYRSLKSFKKSQWDPKENLPESYSSIYHFSSFKATQRAVMADMRELAKAAQGCGGRFWGKEPKPEPTCSPGDVEMDNSEDEDEDILEGCVPSGSYVTVTLEEVPQKDYDVLGPDALLSAVTLLTHENKVSVLHMGLTQGTNCNVSNDLPVKSKDILTFRCGWRTWTGRPTFSQHNLNCDKHKFERYLPQNGSFFAGSVFGPVTYTPCPVLVFRTHNGKKELVATGSMIGADADRIVVKRIVLTGYPVRVHKRFATVKYMFYDPEDVKWFKPAGIITKHGLNGKIEESVGDHGTMKCIFNAPIKQHDTVCLPLYKRIYPKFVDPNANIDDDIGTVRSNWKGHALIVK